MKINFSNGYQETNKSELVVLQFPSLAIVTSVSKEWTRLILTDFFAALIEVSRKTQREARVEFKGVGNLHLFKNREIALSGLEELPGQLTNEEIMRARNKERQNISFIDSASAVLSRGGGMGYSVRASAIDALSLLTPPTTNPSVASSVFGTQVSGRSTQPGSFTSKRELKPLKKDSLWKRYKEKNAAAVKRHEEKVARSVTNS